MKLTNCITASAALLLGLVSCSNEAEIQIQPVAARITADITKNDTRASGASWDENDAIGVSVITEDSKTNAVNKKYITKEGSGEFSHYQGLENGIFFYDFNQIHFSAYYPHTGDEGTSQTININTLDQTNQKAIDYLFAKTTQPADHNNPNVNFAFSHVMAKLTLQVKVDKASGFLTEALQNVTISLSGLKHSGTFETLQGTLSIPESSNSTNLTLSSPAKSSDGEYDIYDLILIPQNANMKFAATVGTETFSCDINQNLEGGKSYLYSITVKKTGLTLSQCTIADWSKAEITDNNLNAEMN